MFNSDGRKGHDEESANQPHQWNWAAKESSATIALVAILALSLLSAQIFVRVQSGNIIDHPQAIQNASELITKVAEAGLRSYLGNQTTTRYYFCKDETDITGYMVLSFRPEIQQDGSWILNGKQLYYPNESIESKETFKVADDLSEYEITTSIRYLTLGRSEVKELIYKEGLLQGTLKGSVSGTTFSSPASVVSTGSTNNLIMPALLDFFSSVATNNDYPEGVTLMLPKVEYYRDNPSQLLYTDKLWVHPGGEAPPEVRSSTPNGRCVEVKWFQNQNSQDTRRTQTVFYDNEHQLVWQKDLPEPASYLLPTTRRDLLAKFPEAESILNQTFRMTSDDK
ncbi:MAG: hypothetical protein GY869_28180 [Planctomycetes bacterium]|nr:hypothetical protein [Planctomycetota bacterium]